MQDCREARRKEIQRRVREFSRSRPPVPPIDGDDGNGPSFGGGIGKAILGFSILIIGMVTCVVVMSLGDDSEPKNAIQQFDATQTALSGTPAINEEEREMWVRQWDHWRQIDLIVDALDRMLVDGQLVGVERQSVCTNLLSWTKVATDARDYIRDYRRADPDLVRDTPSLTDLGIAAEAILATLEEAPCP